MAECSGAISLSPSQAHTSDEEDEAVESPKSKTSPPPQAAAPTSYAELTRKPRGRPPGSRNKPKPPIVITRESDSSMRPAILEVSPGSDIIDSVVKFAHRQHVGLTLISGAGTVSSVTLRHPINHAPSFSLHGPFSILSLSGTYISPTSTCSPNSSSSSAAASAATTSSSSPCCFGISLAGQQGQVFGGIVAGEVIAASQVLVMAATFSNPSFHKLPSEVEDNSRVGTAAVGGGGGGEGGACVSAPTTLHCQLPPEILPWVPTPRPPPRY